MNTRSLHRLRGACREACPRPSTTQRTPALPQAPQAGAASPGPSRSFHWDSGQAPMVEEAAGGTHQLVVSEGRSWWPRRPLGSWGSSGPNPRIPLGIEDAASHEGAQPRCQSGVRLATQPAHTSARLDSPSRPWGPRPLGFPGSPVVQCHPERQAGSSVMEKEPLSHHHLSLQTCHFVVLCTNCPLPCRALRSRQS